MRNRQALPKLKYLHLRSEQGLGTTTIGFQVDTETKTVYYTTARCNKKDMFCRRVGRDICAGRMLKEKNVRTFFYNSYDDVKKELLKHHPDYEVVGEADAKNPTPRKIDGGAEAMGWWAGEGGSYV